MRFKTSVLSSGPTRRIADLAVVLVLSVFVVSTSSAQCMSGGGGRAPGRSMAGGGGSPAMGGAATTSLTQVQQMVGLQQMAAFARQQAQVQQQRRAVQRMRQQALVQHRQRVESNGSAMASAIQTSDGLTPAQARREAQRRRAMAYRAWRDGEREREEQSRSDDARSIALASRTTGRESVQ